MVAKRHEESLVVPFKTLSQPMQLYYFVIFFPDFPRINCLGSLDSGSFPTLIVLIRWRNVPLSLIET